MLDGRFWSGRRVLVTGHTGFKGAWLTLWLARMGAEVAGYSLKPPSRPSLYEQARVGEGIQSWHADVRDHQALAQALAEHGSEVVIHMAAQSLVRTSFLDPVETFDVNVMGTVGVLEAARRAHHVRVVLVVTSDKCYENREWEWGYREDEPMGGHDPYSSSKGCAELVTAAFRRSLAAEGSAAIASARAGNVIGGGDWATDRLVPDLMRGAVVGVEVPIRNPQATRPWQHVLNPLSGYLRLIEAVWGQPELAGGWNFGPDQEDVRTVREVADRLVELWGSGLDWAQDPREHPHEAHSLRLDSSRARHHLGWRPAWGLETALASVVEFHRELAGGGDARSLALGQIDGFEAEAGRIAAAGAAITGR